MWITVAAVIEPVNELKLVVNRRDAKAERKRRYKISYGGAFFFVATVRTMSMFSRRHFLMLAGAAFVSPQQRSEMIVRSARPEDLEMPNAGFEDFITPIDRFFVRTHVTVPKVDLANWRLEVQGHVASPLALTMSDLRRMPSYELISVLECAGNGRGFYDPPVAGLQWRNGAVGNGRWRGVRLADLLKRAGVKPDAVEVLFDGADVPIGRMEDFQRTIPIEKALDSHTLLAYEMNGAALPVKHGFPLRAVVPGWAGDSWTKWVTSIRVLDKEFSGFWMKSAYLYPKQPVAPGSVVAPELMAPVQSLRVKSIIAFPENGTRVERGKRMVVRGAAWSGDSSHVVAIDVSSDGGRVWRPARLKGNASAFGWKLWEFPWTPMEDGPHTILARARDSNGDVQPMVPDWNPSGYLWNGIARVDLNMDANAPSPTAPAAPPRVLLEECGNCHGQDVILQQRLTRAQWDRELNKMIGWGARVNPGDRETLLDYLVKIQSP
jgi:sulfite oxidase